MIASQSLLAVSHLPPERIAENERLIQEARAEANAKLGSDLKVVAALGSSMDAAVLALQPPFLSSGSPLSLPQYLRPCEAPQYARNAAAHRRNRPRIARILAERKRFVQCSFFFCVPRPRVWGHRVAWGLTCLVFCDAATSLPPPNLSPTLSLSLSALQVANPA